MPDDEDRIRCAKCGCPHLPVVRTRHNGGCIVRVRECRHCFARVVTRERVTKMRTARYKSTGMNFESDDT